MIKINENSEGFQKEVICYLFQKIFESFIKEPTQKKKCNSDFINLISKKKIVSVESLLSNLDFIIKEFSLPKNPVDEFIRKNYFKAIQIIKKQKEMLNTFLKTEDSLKLLSREILAKDLSQGRFLVDTQDRYSLKLSNGIIPEIGFDRKPMHTQFLKEKEDKTKEIEKKNSPLEEISVLKELLTLFPEIEAKPKDILKNIFKFDYEVLEEKKSLIPKEKNINHTISEEVSILQEILDFFGLELKEKEGRLNELHELIIKEDNSMIETNPLDSVSNHGNHLNTENQDFEKIPLEIGAYWDLRVKLQNFKLRNQIQEYQEFLNHSDNTIKTCIGILNIINKESQSQNFSKDNALQNLADHLNFSYESIQELYNRIKKYNTFLGYVKQGGQYLKEKNPKLYPFFLKIQTSLLELIDSLEEYSFLNNEEFKQEIEKKIKILLLFIQEEEIRTNLMSFLISFFVKARNLILKS
ncbi:MAG: hypothetical protein ACK4UJ_04775 [Leptonema sp. (in: bacteria)]